MIVSIRFTIVVGNQDLSVIWNILKILKILMSMLYLMFSPLMLTKTSLIKKVMNVLWKEGKSQITIHLIQCMLTLHNIRSKRLMLISSKKNLGKETPLYGTQNIGKRLLISLKEKAPLYVDGEGLTNNQQNRKG